MTSPSREVSKRVGQIGAGAYEEELDRMMSAGTEEFEKAFRGFQGAQAGN